MPMGLVLFAVTLLSVTLPGVGVGEAAGQTPLVSGDPETPPAQGPPIPPARPGHPDGSVLVAIPQLDARGMTLDGRPDEALWREALTLSEFHQLTPVEGGRPSQATEVRVFYDQEALYVSARLQETDPSAIVDRDFERNAFHRSTQDGFGLVLDTNLDGRTAFGFIVTPSGARTDIAIVDERRVSWNTDWNAFWDAEAHQNASGWTLEMRIPFSSLRFEPDPDGAVRMGLITWRYMARADEFNVFPRIPNNWDNSGYKPALAAPIVFEGLTPRNPIFLKPYALGGLGRESRLGEGALAYTQEAHRFGDVGVDLKYNLTSNLILDATFNTDFAQVEADDMEVRLDRFSLFFPEKRDFFQERSDLFDFGFPGGPERLFHSRNIGIVGGQSIPIHGGARLTGSRGGWNLGLLNMQTAAASVGGERVPGENFGVVRLQRPVWDGGSYVGGILTSRTDLGSEYNVVYAVDADLHLGGDVYLDLKAGQSVEPDSDLVESSMFTAGIQRRGNRGFFYGGSFRHVGTGFHPAAGFLQRTGYNRVGGRNGYGWFPGPQSSIQRQSVYLRTQLFWDHRFRELETMSHGLGWNLNFRNGASAGTELGFASENLSRGFSVGEAAVPAGSYRMSTAEVNFASATGRAVRLEGGVRGGEYFGGNRAGASMGLSWNPGTHFFLGTDSRYDRIRVPTGEFQVLLSRVRIGTAVSRNLTASAFVQHNSSDQTLAPNIRIRYNPREGSDLFLVYNEALNTSLTPDDRLGPTLPRSQRRSIQMKYTYTFTPR
jgi:hypothetical protein